MRMEGEGKWIQSLDCRFWDRREQISWKLRRSRSQATFRFWPDLLKVETTTGGRLEVKSELTVDMLTIRCFGAGRWWSPVPRQPYVGVRVFSEASSLQRRLTRWMVLQEMRWYKDGRDPSKSFWIRVHRECEATENELATAWKKAE